MNESSPVLSDTKIPDALARLYAAVQQARSKDPNSSRTARLFADGTIKMANKLGEEAIEVGIDAVKGNASRVVAESADLLYNLMVLWAALDINPDAVWKEMARREALFGIAEKERKQLQIPQ